MNRYFFPIFLLLMMCAPAAAQNPTDCIPLKDHEYQILDYSANQGEGEEQFNPIINEYGVMFNTMQMPYGYEVPTEIKTFATKNSIAGVVIVPNYNAGSDGVVAGMLMTEEGKRVLIISDNIAKKPVLIVKALMGITQAKEVQQQTLRSVVQVDDKDRGWQARFAKKIEHGIEKITGGSVDSEIDYEKILIEDTGPFREIFGEDKMTLRVKDYGPYDIRINQLANPITTVPGILAYLVMEISYLNPLEKYEESLYIGDDGRMYSCR